jgi:hypothetical protein
MRFYTCNTTPAATYSEPKAYRCRIVVVVVVVVVASGPTVCAFRRFFFALQVVVWNTPAVNCNRFESVAEVL